MPINPSNGLFYRVWRFVDQFMSDEAIRRSDLDDALDDFLDPINEALAVKEAAEVAAGQAQAFAAGAATAGALAGAAAGAEAAVTAAAPLAAAAAGSAAAAASSASQAEEYADTALEVQEQLTAGADGFIARTGVAEIKTRVLTAGTGIEITNPAGVAGNPTIAVKDIPLDKLTTTGTPDNTKFLRGDGAWSFAAPVLALYAAQATVGNDGPAFPNVDYAALEITHERYDDIGITLAANQLVFANAGKYLIEAEIAAYNGSGGGRQAQLRLYNATTSAVLEAGQVTNSSTATPMSVKVAGVVTLAAGAAIEVQGRASNTGVLQWDAAGFGTEVGLLVKIQKLS